MIDVYVPHRSTLERLPGRAITFLNAYARHQSVRRALGTRGIGREEIAAMWRLLHVVGGYEQPEAVVPEVDASAAALVEVLKWDDEWFGIAKAALYLRFPEQHAFLFAGNLKVEKDARSVVSVRTFLERLDELERRGTDAAVLELLARRGITAAERARVSALVALVQSPQDEAEPEGDEDAAFQARRQEALVELYHRFDELVKIARTVVTQRRLLISLGLASAATRATRSNGDDEPSEDGDVREEEDVVQPPSGPVRGPDHRDEN